MNRKYVVASSFHAIHRTYAQYQAVLPNARRDQHLLSISAQ